jgi:7-cyano-7-deazaguanine reductase
MSDTKKLKSLGGKTKYYDKPDIGILETFENQHQDYIYLIPFVCTEFTSLCPKTGQPDFATLEIVYIPRVKMVESKSLKLYLFSYRNEGSFHEDVINRIFKDLWKVLNPKYLRIFGNFNVRGGIAIKPLISSVSEKENDIFEKNVIHLLSQWDRIK